MKNLNHVPGNSFDAFEGAVNRKYNGQDKNLLIAAFPQIRQKFDVYDENFANNNLEALHQDGFHVPINAQLKSLYDFGNAAIRSFRTVFESLQSKTVRYTCQYCSMESTEAIDHYVSQAEFPEYVIHPKNLIPSCSRCNGYKGQRWRVDGTRNFINLYLDILPEEPYLFLNVFADQDNAIDFSFELDNLIDIDDAKWSLISNHFKDLHLRERMRRKAIAEFTEFRNRVRMQMENGGSREEVTEVTLQTCNANRIAYGANYWRAVLEEGLVRSDLFWDTIFVE